MTDPIPESEIQITVTHTATAEFPSGTTCWVVESHRDPEHLRYWGGYFFVEHIEDAVLMLRKKDADSVRAQFSQFKAYFSVIHKWL